MYLSEPSSLKNEFDSNVEMLCLNHKSWGSLLTSAAKLRHLIKERKPVLVHSHLFMSTIVARMSTPKHVPLFTTLHSIFSIDAFQKNKKSLWIEKLTLKKRHTLIGVSNFVLDDYLKYVPFAGKRFVLYNFLPDCFFNCEKNSLSKGLKCIAVGNLKKAKNYTYLLQIFSNLKNIDITLDIFGEGTMKKEIQKEIEEKKLAVKMCGKAEDVKELLKNYDLFIQASEHEGFGLSVIEAMASKVPSLVSDIPVFKEITSGHAHFFPLSNSKKAASILIDLFENKQEREKHVEKAFSHCRLNYSATAYKEKLLCIYYSSSQGQ